jgi:hypothetical protein
MEKMNANEAIDSMGARWGHRDRLVAVCVADYTDLALGLGEMRMGLSVFACSSANLSQAHSRASRMGHEAGAVAVDGLAGEDFKRVLGMVGMSWSKSAKWPYRFLDVDTVSGQGLEVGLFYARGDLGRTKPDVRRDAEALRVFISMYGVESSPASAALFVTHETSTMAFPARHEFLWSWLAHASKA